MIGFSTIELYRVNTGTYFHLRDRESEHGFEGFGGILIDANLLNNY